MNVLHAVRKATDADASSWNTFLDNRPLSSPLARYEWRAALKRGYGVETFFLIAEREGEMTGLLPVYETAGGRPARLHSLRFGLTAAEPQAALALLAHLGEERAARGAGRASITSGTTPLPLPWPMRRQKTVVLELGGDEDATWRGMRDKTRNMVRKAQRAGLSVSDDGASLTEFHALYADALLRRGIPVHRRSFFEAIMGSLGDRIQLLTARRGGRVAAGMLLVYGREAGAYPYQAVAEEFRNSGAVQLLNWEAMRRCAQRGVRLLDMGESREGGAVYASKINFGGAPRDLFYYDWPPPSAEGQNSSVSLRTRIDDLLMRRAPLWLRRPYAERKLRLGRLV